jgi:ATP phosphoribosyltransferase regulatory subunit HisZ
MAFSAALVESFGIGDDDEQALLDALHDRDYPLLETILDNVGVDDEARRALQQTVDVSGAREVLAHARRLSRTTSMEQTVGRLETVRDLVAAAGYEGALAFDLGLFQDLAYYTGIVVEAYAPGVGLPIATGGRYDGLGAHFEWDVPGVGVALSVDRLRLALEEAGVALAALAPPLQFVGGLELPEQAGELRQAGLAVAALPAAGRPAAGPVLRHERGRYELEPLDGAPVSGSWRDVLQALGLR